jgi:hypothetical protein
MAFPVMPPCEFCAFSNADTSLPEEMPKILQLSQIDNLFGPKRWNEYRPGTFLVLANLIAGGRSTLITEWSEREDRGLCPTVWRTFMGLRLHTDGGCP